MQGLSVLRQAGLRSWATSWGRENLVRPVREMTRRQLVVAVSVGAWGGIFPFPLCTMPSTLFSVFAYSAGVPKRFRFNAPMGSIAILVNGLMFPANLTLMPCFIGAGQKAYSHFRGEEMDGVCFTREVVTELQEKPRETLQRFGAALGLGVAAWAMATPLVLGHIRVLGAVSALMPRL
uniref:DUF2062 domain-containing protein n=1 Tax=Alexandrium andersonii TaxID=327968 RepID=A0A7S2HTH0_9DINO|mmetsp:Transcript_74880/g.167776  ORF Transcript_74880/g.167776 Transcript_74880/m.167776 type:complete len:178 (+) Transcript_74880:89-622(+)